MLFLIGLSRRRAGSGAPVSGKSGSGLQDFKTRPDGGINTRWAAGLPSLPRYKHRGYRAVRKKGDSRGV